jgi:hypothetical protein
MVRIERIKGEKNNEKEGSRRAQRGVTFETTLIHQKGF